MMKIYDRSQKKYIEEIQYGKNKLSFLYNNAFGRIILKIVINPLFSKIYSYYKKSTLSKKDIQKLIDQYKIDMTLYEEKDYSSFNDFFTRKIKKEKRKIPKEKNSFISPADSKLIIYKISNQKINIKDTNYTIEELVKDRIDLSEYKNGYCLVFRLSMDDYHHYCYPDNGKLEDYYQVKGKLHTVSSISENYKIYKENKREVSILKTDSFNELIYIEVGALLVGEIKNNYQRTFKKGEEKGYFSLGGSTIVILVKDNVLKLDQDIVYNSEKKIETKVKYGEKIGVKIC